MRNSSIHSDQLYNWSANEPIQCRLAPSASGPLQTVGPAGPLHFARLSDRTLQTLRPSRLQMSTGARTRPQVLLVDQPGRQPTRDGLRPGGVFQTSLPLSAELPESASTVGEDLQCQPRVVTATSQVLTTNAHGAFNLIPARSRFGWDPRRQFFAGLAASWLCFINANSNSGDRP
jgi:hypothetical protein